MVLENFIVDAPIVWDRVGKNIFENPHVKQGRKMRVQITNAGMVEDLSGFTLALGWKHTVSGVDGLDVFEDSSEANVGIFEMAYTENLMTNLGNLKASLVLTSVEDMVVAESNDFYVKVDNSPFGEDAEQGVGSYTRLAEILLNEESRIAAEVARASAEETRVTDFNALVDSEIIAQNVATKLQAKEAEYLPRLVSNEQQLAETAKKTEKIVSVKEYGAVGDGIIDDTTAIQNTINALNAGDTLLMPNGTYRTTNTITVDKEITLDGNQATIECDHLLIGLKIKKAVGSMGYGSARRLTANISVSRKMLTTDPNAIGVEITDCYRGWFDFKRLSTHGIGMRLVGEKDGTTYNRFNLGSVTDCYVGIQAETLTDVGWVTENTVYGGNFGSGNITSKEQTDSHIKLLNSGVRIMDNNKFFSCSFEGFQKNGVIIDRAKHNLFFGCRFEVPFADFLLKLLDVTDNQSNQFWGCFGLAETLKNGKIYDEGMKNRISGSEYPVGGFEYYEKTVYYFNKPGQVKQTGFNSGLTVIPLGGRTLREITASASSLTIDFSRGDHFDVTCVTGVDITTIAFANIPSIGVLPTISFIQAAGGNTISGFPSYFLSTGDAVPVKRAYGRDVYQLARGNAYTNEIYALSHYKN